MPVAVFDNANIFTVQVFIYEGTLQYKPRPTDRSQDRITALDRSIKREKYYVE